MKIAYIPFKRKMASFRYRALIPAAYLVGEKHSVVFDPSEYCDWVILSKHKWEDFKIRAKRICFDICDEHFEGEHESHYREWCKRADLITCNSREMQRIIKRETGRDAVVIDDPYESPECEPRCHLPLLWFGSRLNLHTLEPWIDRLPEMVVISDAEGATPWSPETMEAAWEHCGITILPTGPKKGKSANRAVESIRRGLYPVCGPLPAYQELGLCEDIIDGVNGALQDPVATKDRVRDLQELVRERFNPLTIGQKWEMVLASSNS